MEKTRCRSPKRVGALGAHLAGLPAVPVHSPAYPVLVTCLQQRAPLREHPQGAAVCSLPAGKEGGGAGGAPSRAKGIHGEGWVTLV